MLFIISKIYVLSVCFFMMQDYLRFLLLILISNIQNNLMRAFLY